MDPTANIARQRELTKSIMSLADGHGRFSTDAARSEALIACAIELAELVNALDEWRRKGGFDPYAGTEPTLATLSFQPEAYDSAAAFFGLIAQTRSQPAPVPSGMIGYCVTVVPKEGEPYDAEVLNIVVDESDGQYKVVLAPWGDDADRGDRENTITLDIYDDILRLEVV